MIQALILAAATAMCTAQPDVSAEQAVDRYTAAYNSHDIAAIRLTIAPSAIVRAHHPSDEGDAEADAYPIEQILHAFETTVFVESPTVRIESVNRMTQGGRVAQIQDYVDGDGRMLAVYTVSEGCIVSFDHFWDEGE